MNETTQKTQPDFLCLPNITFRQLEVFCVVCREASYANAALELRSTRANIKRVCDDFEKAVGRPLFDEGPNRTLVPTPFAQGLISQVNPLSRGLRRLGESVKAQHEKGRILRFAAAGEFFKGGLFTDFLARLQISDAFRPCFLRIETKRFRTALLNAECDVYFGVGIIASDRLDLIDLGPIPWKIEAGSGRKGKLPAKPADLPAGKWWIANAGETEATSKVLEAFQAAGAKGGRILVDQTPAADEIVFSHETTARHSTASDAIWPCFQFSAVLRKHHPYSELMPRLMGAALA
ncbi:MAG: LysR family transcriptional regulator [Verrucomicrobiota bacterium]